MPEYGSLPKMDDEERAFVTVIVGAVALHFLVKIITGFSILGTLWDIFWGAPWMSS